MLLTPHPDPCFDTTTTTPHADGLAAALAMLKSALDEVDYGVLLLGTGARVLHLNRRAGQLLADTELPLQVCDGRLRARRNVDAAILLDALAASGRGLRRLLALGDDQHRQLAVLVPVAPGVSELLLGRTNMCEQLSVHGYARALGLTDAESRVLGELGQGMTPAQIAERQGVKISTVRTQIGAIRVKACAGSIRELQRQVASLPPMLNVLRVA